MTASTPPPAGSAGTPTSSTATLLSRFFARLLDALIIGLPFGIVFALLGFDGTGVGGWLLNALFAVAYFGYYVAFESNTGATLGKKLLGISVVQADGTPPTTEAAAKRNVWMLFGLIPTFLGGLLSFVAIIVIAVTIGTNEHNRGKHDEIAGTAVMS